MGTDVTKEELMEMLAAAGKAMRLDAMMEADRRLKETVIEVMKSPGFAKANKLFADLSNQMRDDSEVNLDDFIVASMFGTAIVAMSDDDTSNERVAHLARVFAGIAALAAGMRDREREDEGAEDAPVETV